MNISTTTLRDQDSVEDWDSDVDSLIIILTNLKLSLLNVYSAGNLLTGSVNLLQLIMKIVFVKYLQELTGILVILSKISSSNKTVKKLNNDILYIKLQSIIVRLFSHFVFDYRVYLVLLKSFNYLKILLRWSYQLEIAVVSKRTILPQTFSMQYIAQILVKLLL